MAADSRIVHARRISMTWMILCGGVRSGLLWHCILQQQPGAGGRGKPGAERVFIELAQVLFNPWIAGILLSAILAAVIHPELPAAGLLSAITEDLYKAFLRKGASRKSWCG